MQRLSPTQTFNVLHLRAEEDWVQHCARWERKQDGGAPGPVGSEGIRLVQSFQQQLPRQGKWQNQAACFECHFAGLVRDNCLNNTEAVGDSLALHGIDAQASSLPGQPHALHRLPGSPCSSTCQVGRRPACGSQSACNGGTPLPDCSSFKGLLILHLLPLSCAGAAAGPH